MAFDEMYDEYERRRAKALAMGGPERLARRKNAELLNARERIDYLVDPGSWVESGLFTVSHIPAERESSPGDGKITGYGSIEGREAVVISNDFTVKGASSSVVNMKRIGQMRRTALERGIPMVFLGESSGARIPDNMGAYNMGAILGGDATQYRRLREQPWASAILGMAYGSATWYGCLSHITMKLQHLSHPSASNAPALKIGLLAIKPTVLPSRRASAVVAVLPKRDFNSNTLPLSARRSTILRTS